VRYRRRRAQAPSPVGGTESLPAATFQAFGRLDQLTSEPASHRPSRGRPPLQPGVGLPAALLALVVLLAVVALASGGHRAPSGRAGSGPSHTALSYLFSAYLVLGVATAGFVVYLLLTERDQKPVTRKRREIRQLVSFLLLMIALLVFFGGKHNWLSRLHHKTHAAATTTTGAKPTRKPRAAKPPPASTVPGWTWVPAFVALGLLASGVVAYFTLRRKPPAPAPGETMAEALVDVLEDALEALRRERDPRRAIIAAYARMERLLAASGVPRHPHEAPFEYLGRVLLELDVSRSATFDLTELFERAKFSRHEIGPELRDEALDALATVRDELRTPAAAA
jgi:hypothetical protein